MGSGSINQMIGKLCVLRSWLIPPGTTPRIESPNCCNDSWVASPLLKNHKMTLPRNIYKVFYWYLGKTAHPKTSRVPRNSRKSWYPRTRHIPKIGLTRKFKNSWYPGNRHIQKIGHAFEVICMYIYMRTCDVIWMCTVNVISIHMYTNASLWIYIYIYISVVYIHLYIYCYTYIYYIHIYMYE